MVTSNPHYRQPGERHQTYLIGQVLAVTLLLVFCAQAVNLSGLDLTVARWFYDAQAHAFPYRASRALEILGHRLVLVAPVGMAVAAAGAAVASRWLPVLRPWRGVLWATALTCALGQVVIGQLKHYTALPRPYELSLFGGYAPYPDHFWAASRREGGGALPSGHAGAGYALLSLYFAGWAAGRPAWRWAGLTIGIVAGIGFSLVRIAQGAHFLSQTLWSAAVMWFIASLLFYPVLVRPRRRRGGQGEPACRGYATRAGATHDS
ncbi:phosphatase PAP2 family protein [Achromobacter aloeverae]|uniref:Acid phosphatase n=1 Tax=Achromobacter aloeverae TaxID=1750518 RepID=A0A4Q1HKW3_9BURK|nr:phosphatase PAP2 family protein [Achromobacter aloeverae]RXN90533.1 acid phosphatase [Achromobacter aloeverae]